MHPSPYIARPPRAQSGPTLAVLILDDERFDRHRLARLCSGLEQACTVTNAASLGAFEHLLDAEHYDLILVDYALPDGTGLEALDAVHRSARNFQSATLMITGQLNDEVAVKALAGGCSDYLSKDELTRDTFVRAVAQALDKSALKLEVAAQSFARAEVEAVLEVFARRFASDIKPMVSRTMRQLRDHRARPEAETLKEVEASCLSIWETLVALERHSGTEMMTDTIQSQMPPPAAVRKPPSPFRRMSH